MTALPLDTADIESEAPTFQAVRMLQVELGQPLPDITAYDARTKRRYRRAQLLVRLHSRPLGLVYLHLAEDGLSASACANRIWQDLRQVITDHLCQDGLPDVSELTPGGFVTLG